MTLFDDVDALLGEALSVSAHARPHEGADHIGPGDDFVATIVVENRGLGEEASTAARTAFLHVSARVQATPFATPVVDGQPVREVQLELGELIFGEASSRELSFHALGALDGSEPFVRVHVQGQLDLPRFFRSQTVHQFSTDIRRPVAHNAAATAFAQALRAGGLPGGFEVQSWSFDFDDAEMFSSMADDPVAFRRFVRERVAELAESRGLAAVLAREASLGLDDLYLDVHPTGGTGALALALWFVSFDQGEATSFDVVVERAQAYLGGFDTFEHRRELRLFKGFENDRVLADAMTATDLPVVVDYGASTITLWAGSLRG